MAVRTPSVMGGISHVNHKSTIVWYEGWYMKWKVYKLGTIGRTVMSTLNSTNVCSNSVQNILSSNFLLEAWILKCIVLIALLYGCETWCVTIREKTDGQYWEHYFEENIWTRETEHKRSTVEIKFLDLSTIEEGAMCLQNRGNRLPFYIAAYPGKVELSVKMNFIISLDSLTNVIRIVKLERLHEWGTLREVRNAWKLSLKIVMGCKLGM